MLAVILLLITLVTNAKRHSVSYIEKDSFLTKYVILDECGYYSDEYYARISYADDKFTIMYYPAQNKTCDGLREEHELVIKDIESGTLEEHIDDIELDNMTGKKNPSNECHSHELSTEFFKVREECFLCEEEYSYNIVNINMKMEYGN